MSDHSVFEMFKSLDHAEHLYKEVSALTKTDEERDISFLLSMLVNTKIESVMVQMTASDLHDALLLYMSEVEIQAALDSVKAQALAQLERSMFNKLVKQTATEGISSLEEMLHSAVSSDEEESTDD